MGRYMQEETERTYLAVPIDVLAWFTEEAKRKGWARSVLFKLALEEYMINHKAGPKRKGD